MAEGIKEFIYRLVLSFVWGFFPSGCWFCAPHLRFVFCRGPGPVVQNQGILCSCWEETASTRRSCCPSQTSASPSPDPVSANPIHHLVSSGSLRWLLNLTWRLYSVLSLPQSPPLSPPSPPRSSHENWLWKHGGEDGVQREVRQPGVFQLQATGQAGAADHQTQQRGRFLFQ